MMKRLALVFVLLALLGLSACSPAAAPTQGPSIEVSDPWVRAVPGTDGMNMGMNGALYMVINNYGDASDSLLRVETQAAGMAQVHLSEVDASGVSSMHEVEAVEVPAGGSVEFKTGGYHVMLMGLKLNVGSTAHFTLYFKNAGTVVVDAPIKAP